MTIKQNESIFDLAGILQIDNEGNVNLLVEEDEARKKLFDSGLVAYRPILELAIKYVDLENEMKQIYLKAIDKHNEEAMKNPGKIEIEFYEKNKDQQIEELRKEIELLQDLREQYIYMESKYQECLKWGMEKGWDLENEELMEKLRKEKNCGNCLLENICSIRKILSEEKSKEFNCNRWKEQEALSVESILAKEKEMSDNQYSGGNNSFATDDIKHIRSGKDHDYLLYEDREDENEEVLKNKSEKHEKIHCEIMKRNKKGNIKEIFVDGIGFIAIKKKGRQVKLLQ